MKKRFRQIPLIIGGLAAVALGTVGFSAWVITGTTDPATSGPVSIKAAEVVDQRMSIAITAEETNVLFDCLKSDETGPIIHDKKTTGEDLTFGFTVTVKNAYGTDAVNSWYKGLTLTMNVVDNGEKSHGSSQTAYEYALAKNYIVQPLTAVQNIDTTTTSGPITLTDTGSTCNVSVSEPHDLQYVFAYKFNWGTAFNGKNPSTFANGQFDGGTTSGALTQLDDVVKALNVIKEINNNVSFTVTVAAK